MFGHRVGRRVLRSPLRLTVWFAAFVLVAAACTANEPSGREAVLIDTDMGFDDVRALLLLLESDMFDVIAVSVDGNGLARCPRGAENARAILDSFDLQDVPVACGSSGPLEGFNLAPTAWRDTADALEGMGLGDAGLVSDDAPGLIADAVRAARSPVTILTLGPLTNLATALAVDPGIAASISGVHVMGGAVDVGGNILDFDNPVAEFNIWFDPVAAQQVLGSDLDVTLIPLDATNAVPITPYFYDVFAAANLDGRGASLISGYTAANPFFGGIYHWDDLAAATLIDESVVRYEERRLTVVTEGPEQGRTMESAAGSRVRVAVSADPTAFEALFYEAIVGDANLDAPPWIPDAIVSFDGQRCTYDGPDPLPESMVVQVENSSDVNAIGALVVRYDEGTTADQFRAFSESNPTAPPPFQTILGFAPLPHGTSSVWAFEAGSDATVLCVVTIPDTFELAGVRILE